MFFASDNAGPVHPRVLEALTRANEGYASGYGADDLTTRTVTRIREVFEAPGAAVFFVATGTAANALALATLAQPFQTVFCTDVAHIHEDECNAPEFFTGGAKLTLVPTDDGRMTPDALRAAIEAEESRGIHGPQRGPVSITNITERGTRYTSADIAALAKVAHDHGLPVHLDGARFANALVAEGCTPAEMTWKAGVDVLSFGGTKNGLMGVEAVILFDPARAREFEYRRKRGGHLFSKHRYLTAQMAAYLEGDLWLDLARAANAANARLTRALGQLPEVDFLYETGGNMTFASWSAATHRRLFEAGAVYYLWDGTLEGAADDARLGARLVCDWSMTDDAIDRFIEVLRG
ncbi:low specificity L-threonine aldolase [Maritimibacter sp. DP1N21-5]|uniref:threonine aldolase family protein n=1 Tax=Maritimibacter sp. DP1N21-5 TaxID=2836867 RepID=UPI001C45C978|nr:beta-eliminating lyase-related protein [Maritimibacter sp. DP1N21-5]MBV7410398.1 aminotransferase class V-fold PLP-dependent enzyme [Maritimibacter sp. DP1N21-5]